MNHLPIITFEETILVFGEVSKTLMAAVQTSTVYDSLSTHGFPIESDSMLAKNGHP